MMRTNIGNVPLEKELLKERNWSKHLEYTENLWRKDIQGLNISARYLDCCSITHDNPMRSIELIHSILTCLQTCRKSGCALFSFQPACFLFHLFTNGTTESVFRK